MRYMLYANDRFIQGSDDRSRLETLRVDIVRMWMRQMLENLPLGDVKLQIRMDGVAVRQATMLPTTRSLRWQKP